MLAIEAKRVLKDSLVIFLVLAAIVAGIIGSHQDIYLAPALELFLLLYASFAGWSLFERERQESAGEYMLALPLSRCRLLLLKLLPRLLSVFLVLLLYLRLHHSLHLPSFLPPSDFSVLYAGFFLLAIAFSISFRNFISAFFTVCLLSVGQVLLILLLDPGREIGSAILQANLAVLAVPVFFFILFQSYDVRPAGHFNKRFFPGLLVIAGLIAGFLFLTAPPNWKNLHLTRQGLLIKNSCKHSEIDLKHKRRRLPGCLIALRETVDGRTLFAVTRKPKRDSACTEINLVALDLKSGELKTLFSFAAGWSIAPGYPGEIGAFGSGTYSLFLQNARQKRAKVLQIRGGQVQEFPIQGDFYDPKISYVFYLDKTPPQLVIYSEQRLYRLDVSGRAEELAKTDSMNAWQDKVLTFEPAEMRLYRVGPEFTLLQRWQGKYKKGLRRISGFESRSVVFHAGRDYYWMDLERQQERRLETQSPPYTYQQSGESFNVVFASGSVFTIREIRNGRERETVWAPGFQPSGIRISPFGLLVFREKEWKVQRFSN